MKKSISFVLNLLGWMMILAVLLLFSVYCVASDPDLYYRLQMDAGILDEAGISREDLWILDERLSETLFVPLNADTAVDNREIEVFGSVQPPFNERELEHLYDCRRLLSPTRPGILYALLLLFGAAFLLCGGKGFWHWRMGAAWAASALILLLVAVLGIWAAVDFSSAFTFFHELLFTNDLWLLDPQTDLLIRICPSSMFASMGLRIGLYATGALLGFPLLVTILNRIFERRKRKIT